jgi:hypothetical protein
MSTKDNPVLIEVSAEDACETGICCSKDRKSAAYQSKVAWLQLPHNKDIRLLLVNKDVDGIIGFAEYMPSGAAWRPVSAENYMFIQCIAIYQKESRSQGVAGKMLAIIEEKALSQGMNGVCTMCSSGTWMAGKGLFVKNGYTVCDQLGRFELLYKAFRPDVPAPSLIDRTSQLNKYQGWHLLYADQCPWHQKAVSDLMEAAVENHLELHVTRLETPEQARLAPTGYGTFGLIKDGKLLADHYISKTRFLNILRKEL